MQTYRWLIYLAAFWALVAGGCGDQIEPGRETGAAPPTVKAPVGVAEIRQQPFIYEAVGTVTARTASTIASKLMGTVKAVHVTEGDTVQQGDLLVVIDERQVSAQLEQAEAALAEARRAEASAVSAWEAVRAQAELARATHQRYTRLMQENSASRQEFDEVAARHRQAEAALTQAEAMREAAGHRVEQARAGVAAARVSKKDAAVRAPYAGKVTAKMVDEGDLASPGTPLLTLEKQGVYCADLVLPERHIQAIGLGEQVDVVIPALSDDVLKGTVGRIVPSADQQSRSFQVKVALPQQESIRSGMFARVRIPLGQAGMMVIPESAVVQRGQLTGIYLVDDGRIARFRLIRLGQHMGDAAEVLSGLPEGSRYVVAPPPQMADGVRVEDAS